MRAFMLSLFMILLLIPLAAAQQAPEPRGPRPDVIFGQQAHYVTLTFYVDDPSIMQELVTVLDERNVTAAVFFVDPAIPGNSSIIESARQLGYLVRDWPEKSSFDPSYPPTKFQGVTLSDRSVLGRTDKMADIAAFYNLALHSANSSIIAFTPPAPSLNHNASAALLEEILGNQERTFVFTSESSLLTVSMPISEPISNTTRTHGSIGSNTTSNIVLDAGTWNMSRLHTRYPADIAVVSTRDGIAYLVETSIIVEEGAQVNIDNSRVLLVSPTDDTDRRIEVEGNLTITDSLVTSWDLASGSPDGNPYHQRPFIFVDEGRLAIDNSSISHMGFLLSGFGADRSARAAIIIHEGDGFSVTNSSLSFNYDALFARNSSEATIAGTEIYGSTRTGISLRSGSSNLSIIGNHVHDNGYEGIECIECVRSVFAKNIAEHNKEAGIKLIASNFSAIHENDVRYNEKSGIYLRDNSTENSLRANTITDNREGIRLAGNSSNNLLFANTLIQNREAIDIDESSRPNQQRNNRIVN